uniref:Uncharacterized protein n=1 Tax=Arundo donax TaxID=35708 RepID=A0A0A8Z2B9_ARUDO
MMRRRREYDLLNDFAKSSRTTLS